MKKNLVGDILWAALFVVFSGLFILPSTRGAILGASKAHPYIAAFLKFMLLASMGELLAVRITKRAWPVLTWATAVKAVVWGLFGIAIAFMFELFWRGTQGAFDAGMLWMPNLFMHAFWTSSLMNLTFGPMFMALHRVTDGLIDSRYAGKPNTLKRQIGAIDWVGFIGFVIGRTIPLFWIPAHTITFMLPPELRVLIAAYLSIMLGVLLSLAKMRKKSA